MPRRTFLTHLSLLLTLAIAPACSGEPDPPPNIVLILADDLGLAELGCTGSELIATPNLDRMREQGMLFTNAYSGSTVCAPSRCSLLTGLHPGHAQIRDNGETPNLTAPPGHPESTQIGAWEEPPVPLGLWGGQRALTPGTETIASLLKAHGYATGCVGKWGLGGPGSGGEPNLQGFDFFFGYNCQRHAHNYFPRYLDRNGERVELAGNTRGKIGETYAPDLMLEEAIGFIRDNADNPFFLYYATPVPHLALQVPDDSLAEYAGKWEDQPYTGKSYQPHSQPRAAYAAMVTRMDRDLGKLFDELESLGLSENTIVVFTSDNGSTFDLGGYDPEFFNGTGGLRGHKCNLYEGGLRVPLIIKWPNRVAPGGSNATMAASWDLMPTLLSLLGAPAPTQSDGIDLANAILGTGEVQQRDHLYWEYHSGGGWQAVRRGNWKAVRRGMHNRADVKLQLYDLLTDPQESNDIAAHQPDVVATMLAIMQQEHTPSPVEHWNFKN